MAHTLRPAQRRASPDSHLESLLAQRVAQEMCNIELHNFTFDHLTYEQLHAVVGEIVAQTFRQLWATNPPSNVEHN